MPRLAFARDVARIGATPEDCPLPPPFLYLAAPCYGGLASARLMRSLLALRAACARADIAVQLELGGGEALASRGRAGMMAKFLTTQATHLLFADADQTLDSAAVLERLAADEPLGWLGDGQLLVRRDVAERLSRVGKDLRAGLTDVRGVAGPPVPMLFETIMSADRYVTDLAAFAARWAALDEGPQAIR